MSKICECCGKKNNFFIVDEFYITDEKILCEKCAEYIRSDFNAIYYVKTKDEYEDVKGEVLSKCREHFNDDITKHILALLEEKYNKLTASNSTETDNNEATGMFTNIGSKIKTLAQAITLVGVVISIITGIGMVAIDDDLILTGIITAALGAFLSWISSFVLYGFGQLVENSDKLVSSSEK